MSHKPQIHLNASIQEVCKRLAKAAVEADINRAMAAPQGHGASFGGRTKVTSLGDRKNASGHGPEHKWALLDLLFAEAQMREHQAVMDAAAVDGFISEGGQ